MPDHVTLVSAEASDAVDLAGRWRPDEGFAELSIEVEPTSVVRYYDTDAARLIAGLRAAADRIEQELGT